MFVWNFVVVCFAPQGHRSLIQFPSGCPASSQPISPWGLWVLSQWAVLHTLSAKARQTRQPQLGGWWPTFGGAAMN
jgi:hypothetical protein